MCKTVESSVSCHSCSVVTVRTFPVPGEDDLFIFLVSQFFPFNNNVFVSKFKREMRAAACMGARMHVSQLMSHRCSLTSDITDYTDKKSGIFIMNLHK